MIVEKTTLDGVLLIKLDIFEDHRGQYIETYNEKLYNTFPADIDVLNNCEPVYEEVPGWNEDTSGMRSAESLPEKAKDYIKRIENIVGVKVKMVSVGPERSQIISI